MKLQKSQFGTVAGVAVDRYTLSNGNGLSAGIISYGGIITSFTAPDRSGTAANITLGFDTLEGYLAGHPYFGALIGRFGNRIADGSFELDGKRYTLARNDNAEHHLHGGVKGFDKVLWWAEPLERPGAVGVVLSYTSPDGEEGYPGNLEVRVTYSLNEENEFIIEYSAKTDKVTPINLTNHAYWNLAGAGSGKIYDHELQLFCPKFLPERNLIPTGEMHDVAGTAMDFSVAKPLGRDMSEVPGGYDHCFVRDPYDGTLSLVARLREPTSGRCMDISTTKPGVQLYCSNFLDGVKGSGGVFEKHDAVCLETQYYPDAINQPNFPDWLLKPGKLYEHRTVHRFYTD
jgi:aldose 1-epimerase